MGMLYLLRCKNFCITARKNVRTCFVKFCNGNISEKEDSGSCKKMKILNVAEKNDAAKNIAAHLSRGNSNRREGLSKFNKIYEFEAAIWGQNHKMIMTSVSGHLLGYEFVGAYRSWQGCNPISLFNAPVVKQCSEDNYIKIKKTLEREVRGCDVLIIWTDCDREGENIGFEVIQVCQGIKPNIRIYRAKFSEITQQSVHRALQTLGAPNKAVSDAVDVRSELDLRIGAAFTRFQTLRLQKVFPQTLADMLISYGSCQFPTLGFVVERFLAIERFKPEPFWRLKVLDVRDEVSVEFKWERNRLFEELPCQAFLDICQENPLASVRKVTSKPKSKWRPLPLDTVELEKQGSRKLKLNAKETMKIAEKLYTQGFISYPRTETNIFPKELNLQNLVEQQTANPQWGGFAQRVFEDGPNPRQGKKSDQAHPPIHPTKYTDGLGGNEARVYEFVVRHFLACVSKDAEGQETIVEVEIAGEHFIAGGLRIIARNYLDVYVYEKWNAKEIHAYEQGQTFTPTSIEMVSGETSPPNLLTEADLIALMDKHGIGTDATHAEHIDTIKSRQYVGLRDGIHFVPGKLGIGLVSGYDSMGFQMSKPYLRAELEADLKLICDGRKNPEEVLRTQVTKYWEVFKVAIQKANLLDNALAEYLDEQPTGVQDTEMVAPPEDIVAFKCPKCGSNMTLKERRNGAGKYIGCMAFPTCNNSIWFPPMVEEVEVLEERCDECPGDLRKLKLKFRRGAFPLLGTTCITCLGGCNPMVNETLGVRSNSVRRTAGTNDTGYGSMNGTNSSSTQRTNNSSGMSSGSARGSNGRGTNGRNDPKRKPPSNQNSTVGFVRNQNDNRSNRSNGTASNTGRYVGNQNAPGEARRGGASSESSNHNRSLDDGSWGNNDWGKPVGENVFMCRCHERAMQLTVRKEGPNQGRLFYKCAKTQGCDFFLWASDSPDPSCNVSRATQDPAGSRMDQGGSRNTSSSWGNQTGPSVATTSWGNSNTSAASGENVICECGRPARRLTVHKEGPNKGRQFYGCPQGVGSSCKFFKWADEVADDSNSGGWGAASATRPGRGQGRGGGAPKSKRAPGAKRKCGICGVEGHTRKTCPQNAMD